MLVAAGEAPGRAGELVFAADAGGPDVGVGGAAVDLAPAQAAVETEGVAHEVANFTLGAPQIGVDAVDLAVAGRGRERHRVGDFLLGDAADGPEGLVGNLAGRDERTGAPAGAVPGRGDRAGEGGVVAEVVVGGDRGARQAHGPVGRGFEGDIAVDGEAFALRLDRPDLEFGMTGGEADRADGLGGEGRGGEGGRDNGGGDEQLEFHCGYPLDVNRRRLRPVGEGASI